MKKALLVANAASMIKLFNQLNMAILQSMDYEIHVACNLYEGNTISLEEVNRAVTEWKARGIYVHQIDVPRNPIPRKMATAYRQLKVLIGQEKFGLIHCHTPVVAALTRMAVAKLGIRRQVRLLYTAHGFHFYQGAPVKNWLLYYPVEKICSYFTDDLITINREDYWIAEKRFSSARNHYIPGVGVDTTVFSPDVMTAQERSALRADLGIEPGCSMILSVGELIPRKNYRTAIEAIAQLNRQDVRYVICGQGAMLSEMQAYANTLGVGASVVFLGYRKDIPQICSCADVFLHTSYQEGLPVAVMESMACGTPIVASRIRGNVDLIEDGVNGFLCDPEDANGFADKLQKILDVPNLAEELRRNGLQKIKDFDVRIIREQLRDIYCGVDMRDHAAI